MSFGSSNDSVLRQTLIEQSGHLFPHPFYDVSSQYVPRNIKEAFRWAEYLHYKQGTIRSATERIVHYILTEIQYGGEKNEVVEKYQKLLEEQLDIRNEAIRGGIDLLSYGNRFSSLYFPFDRMLTCPSCKFTKPSTELEYEFKEGNFVARCVCGYRGVFKRNDLPVRDPERVKFIRWDPKEIELDQHPVSGQTLYYWEIPSTVSSKVLAGDQFIIDSMPWEILECIRQKKLFKFAPGQIFHQALPGLAGLHKGWGVPPCMAVFTTSWYGQILRRMNEAIANDYIVPQRVLFPSSQSSSSDPATFVSNKNFVSQMSAMVRRHRRDPADFMISPVPLGYQAIGGEGKALDLSQNIRANNEEILNSLGFPSELWYGTLAVQAMPAALRMCENHWQPLVASNNRFLRWAQRKVADYFDWEDISASFRPLKIADDIERRQILLQLASAQQISTITAMSQYGLDFKEEQEKLLEQQEIVQEMQRRSGELQAEMAENTAATGGGGGAPAPGSATVFNVEEQALQLAQQLVGMSAAGNQGQVNRTLDDLARQNRTLYALVKDNMEKLRTQANSEAGRQALAQGFAPGTPGGVSAAPQ